MKIDPFVIQQKQVSKNKNIEIRKEKAAENFEKVFARQLVEEMTKDTFSMSDNNGMMGNSGNMYRDFITDALAGELAAQRKLGMADLLTKYWDQQPDTPKNNP